MGCQNSNQLISINIEKNSAFPQAPMIQPLKCLEDQSKLFQNPQPQKKKKEKKAQQQNVENQHFTRNQFYQMIKDSQTQQVVDMYESEAAIQPDVELSASGNWNALHYAIHFKAFAILDYILKIAYAKGENYYKQLLSAQQEQGWNPAMIAAVYNSSQCFSILLKVGGISPSLKDNGGKTVEQLAKIYGAKKVLYQLQGFTQDIPINSEYLSNLTVLEGEPEEIVIQNINSNKDQSNQNRAKLIQEQLLASTIYNSYQIQAQLKWEKVLSETKGNNFIDQDFPHQMKSITISPTSNEEYAKARWIRPNELMDCELKQIKVFDTIEPNDIQQGGLGVCYLLSTLSAMAEFPAEVIKVFNTRKLNEQGVYSVNFYKQGFPQEVVIDDYFPCFSQRNDPLFVKSNGRELWVMIIEKAWAKFFGSYIKCEKMCVNEAMELIIGSPCFGFWCKDFSSSEIQSKLKDFDAKNYMVACTSKDNASEADGIVACHAYTILSVYDFNGLVLLKIRNPWGSFEWKGLYEDQSSNWSQELKQKTGFVNADDGIFFMTNEEFLSQFQYISVCMVKSDYRLLSKVRTCKNGMTEDNSSAWQLIVGSAQEVSIRVHQTYPRHKQDGFKNSPVEIILYAQNAEILGVGSEHASHSVNCFKDLYQLLQPGKYILKTRVKFVDDRDSSQYGVTLYSKNDCTLEEIDASLLQDLSIQAYKNEAKKNQLFDFNNGCKFTSGWKGQIMYIYGLNQSEQTWNLKISFKNLNNLKLGRGALDNNKLMMIVQKGKDEICTLERINSFQEVQIKWEFDQSFT